MKKIFRLICFVLVVSLVPTLVCSTQAATSSPAPGTTPAKVAFKWPNALRVSTAGVGTTGYITTAAWTPVMIQNTGMKIRTIPEGSMPLKFRWLQTGVVDMMFDSLTDIGSFGLMGTAEYATRDSGPFQIRMIWPAVIMNFGFFVRGDSEIKTIQDIKPTHKVMRRSDIPSIDAATDGLMNWIGVKCEFVPTSTSKAMYDVVAQGKADISYGSPQSSQAFESEANPFGIRWLELPYDTDPQGAKKMAEKRGPTIWGICKSGVKSSIRVKMMITPHMMFSSAKLDPNFVYQYSKWLGDNFTFYENKHDNCKLMSLELYRMVLDYSYIPVHEGTIKYLKEKGVWTAADDKRQKANLELLTKWVNAYQTAINQADDEGISIDPKNAKWMDLWTSIKKDLPILGMQ